MIKQEMARLFHQIGGKIIAGIRENSSTSKLAQLEEREITTAKRPIYIDQLAGAGPEKIDSFYGPIHDKAAAARFGAKNLEEFDFWSWRACGIVALQMILTTELPHLSSKTTMDLIKEGLAINGYEKQGDKGWRHQALVQLAQKYGLMAETKKFIPLPEMALEINKGNYVLISVKSKSGGHFLLGFKAHLEQEGKLSGFTVHDPSSFQQSGEARFLSTEQLSQISTRRIITVAPPRTKCKSTLKTFS